MGTLSLLKDRTNEDRINNMINAMTSATKKNQKQSTAHKSGTLLKLSMSAPRISYR